MPATLLPVHSEEIRKWSRPHSTYHYRSGDQGWRAKETDEELTQRKKKYVCVWGRGTIQEGKRGAGLCHSWLLVQPRRLACVIPSGGLAGQFLLLASRVPTARATSFLQALLVP